MDKKSKAIVIGASSGIGRELALTLSNHGYQVGVMARRVEKLEELQKELSTPSHVGFLDVKQPEAAVENLIKMIERMGGVDLIVINSGTGFQNQLLIGLKTKKQSKQMLLDFVL